MAIKTFDDVTPWPQPAAGVGHNRPPVAIEAQSAFDELIDQEVGLRGRIDDLVGAAGRATATSAETLGRCGQTIIQIRDAMKKIDAAHVAAKAPYLEGGRVVDAAKNNLKGDLENAQSQIEEKQEAYLRAQKKADDERRAKAAAEERRIQQENNRIAREHAEEMHKAQMEANRAAQEAAEQGKPVQPVYVAPIAEPVFVAAPPPPQIERGIVRGPEGAAISGKTIWKAEIADYLAAFPTLQSDPKVREAMDAAASRLAKAGMREIPGVRIFEDIAVSNRG